MKADCHKSWLSLKAVRHEKLIVTKADCHKGWLSQKAERHEKLIVTKADCHRSWLSQKAECHWSWLSQKLIVTKADCHKSWLSEAECQEAECHEVECHSAVRLRDIFPKTVLYLYLFNILLSILSYFSFFVWKYFFFVFELLTRLPSLQLLLKFWQRILSVGLSCKLPNYLLFHHITHFPAKTSYYQKIRWNLNSQIIKNNYTNM